ncbi:hypothetical protein LCGC14_2308810 [marine sediment metagenome]|uniref:Uncharacterized protein n=1 Tax=marine sediment metagenome TaxID=412755 RepID=A0A0F9D8R2_9ZZZZ
MANFPRRSGRWIRTPRTAPVTLPNSDSKLRWSLGNSGGGLLDEYSGRTPPRWEDTPFWPTFGCKYADHTDKAGAASAWDTDILTTIPNGTTVGMIPPGPLISGHYTRPTNEWTHFPQNNIDTAIMDALGIVLGYTITEYGEDANPSTRWYWKSVANKRWMSMDNTEVQAEWVKHLFNHAVRLDIPWVLLDNFHPPKTGPDRASWAGATAMATTLKAALAVHNKQLLANYAHNVFAITDLTDDDWAWAKTCVDGYIFEQPFLVPSPTPNTDVFPALADKATATDTLIKWVEFLDDGLLAAWMINSGNGFTNTRIHEEFIAAVAMMIRKTGHKLFIHHYANLGLLSSDWNEWPADFGAPSSDYTWEPDDVTMKRIFANHTITVNISTRTVVVS